MSSTLPAPLGDPLDSLSVSDLIAAQPLPTWICDLDSGRVLTANPAAEIHLSAPPGSLVGHILLAPKPDSAHSLQAWLDANPGHDTCCQLLRPNRETIATRVAIIRLPRSNPPLVQVTALPPPQDQAPSRNEDELLRAAKRESLELLAGGVAHDFNNLLTALMGNISLARMDSSVSPEVQEWLVEAEKATGRARDLTQQLLSFAKGGEPVRRLTALGPGLRESAQFARQGSRIRCEFALAPDLWPAEVDASQIGQVVHNLMINAVQAMPGGGVVRVGAQNIHRDTARQLGLGPHHFVLIEIRDQGPGIKPEDMARIFQPYFTTKRHGSGLGLATSQTIARRHFGALRVESPPGSGAVFSLYLPASPGAVVETSGAENRIPRLAGRVLFMDDEAAIRQMAPDLLAHIGLTTEAVADGAEAIAAYERAARAGTPFELVILDLTVPAGMGGLETIGRLQAFDPSVRALVSSGYADDEVLRNYHDHGFAGTVTKPYCIAELASVVGRVLGRSPTVGCC